MTLPLITGCKRNKLEIFSECWMFHISEYRVTFVHFYGDIQYSYFQQPTLTWDQVSMEYTSIKTECHTAIRKVQCAVSVNSIRRSSSIFGYASDTDRYVTWKLEILLQRLGNYMPHKSANKNYSATLSY